MANIANPHEFENSQMSSRNSFIGLTLLALSRLIN